GQPVSNPVDDDVAAMDTRIAGKRTSATDRSASHSTRSIRTTMSFIGVPTEVGRLANHCRPEQCSQRGYTDESNLASCSATATREGSACLAVRATMAAEPG